MSNISRTKIVSAILYLFFIPFLAFAGEDRKLTLKDAIEIALKNSRSSKIAELDYEKSKQTIRSQLSALYPQITLSGNYTRNLATPITYLPFAAYDAVAKDPKTGLDKTISYLTYSVIPQEARIGQENVLGSKLSITQVLFNYGLFFAPAITSVQEKAARAYLEKDQSSIIQSVTVGYYQALVAKIQQNLALRNIERATMGLNDSRNYFKNGLVPDVDTLRASITYQNAITMLTQASSSTSISMSSLKTILGLNDTEKIILLDSLSYAPDTRMNNIAYEEAYNEALENHKEISFLRLRSELYGLQKNASLGSLLPTLNFFGEIQTNSQFHDNGAIPLPISALFGVQLSIPLFDGFRSASSFETSKIESETISNQLEQAKESLQTEIRSHISKVHEIISKIESQTKTLNSAKRLYEISYTRWQKGLASQIELSDAGLSLTQAEAAYYQVIYEYLVEKTAFDKTLGRLVQ